MSVQQTDLFGNLITVSHNKIELPTRPNQQQTPAAVVSDNKPNNPQHFLLNGDTQLLYPIGQKSKFRLNLEAIRLLKSNTPIDKTDRMSLIRYGGWGNLSEIAFGQPRKGWITLQNDLKKLLSQEEYEAARASTINAHYTDPMVVKWMWQVITGMGFDGGHVLEPAIGPGVFFALAPEQVVKNSWFYASEKDPITAAIATKLFPQADVRAKPLEQAGWEREQFDLVIGNWPFGNVKVFDGPFFKEFPHLANATLHDYFWLKALYLTRPGGLVVGITSRYTLDKKDFIFRSAMAEQATLLWSVRLPVNTFIKVAGTEVTTDVLFLRKGVSDVGQPPFVNITDEGINEYYKHCPFHLLGTMQITGGRYANALECVAPDSFSLSSALNDLQLLRPGTYQPRQIEKKRPSSDDSQRIIGAGYLDPAADSWDLPHIRTHSYVVGVDWAIYRKGASKFQKQQGLVGAQTSRIREMIEIRDQAYKVLKLNQDYAPNEVLAEAQRVLLNLYNRFVHNHGPLNSRANVIAMAGNDTRPGDPDLPFLLALENYDSEAECATPGDLFSERVIRRVVLPEKVDTAHEALLISLAQHGGIDWETMGKLTNRSQEELLDELDDEVFFNPETGQVEIASVYLSGNLKKKIEAAQGLEKNLEALQKHLPRLLEFSQITIPLGAIWVPKEHYEDFAYQTLGNRGIKCTWLPALGRWHIPFQGASWRWDNFKNNISNAQTYGTSRMYGFELFQLAMNGLKPKIYDNVEMDDGSKARIFNAQETLVAEEKQQLIHQAWQNYLNNNREVQLKLTRLYNDTFNVLVSPKFDGSHLKPIGLTPSIVPYPHQLDDAWGIILGVANQSHNSGLFHIVGAGKTLLMIIASMELKRMGLINKPLHIVQKSTLTGYEQEFRKAYPAARILAMDTNSLTPRRRKRTLNQIATGNYDAIIITHDAFGKMPIGSAIWMTYFSERLDSLDRTIRILKDEEHYSDRGGYTIKQVEKKRANLWAKMEETREGLDSKRDDLALTWEHLGIDLLFADEMHRYKNLFVDTSASGIPGINTSESQRALDFYLKTRELTERCRLVGATATPLTNSICEVFTLQRYFQPEILESIGMDHFDAWRMQFGKVVTSIELDPTGQNFRLHDRFKQFHNVPELLQMFWQFARVRLDPDALGLKRPKSIFKQVIVEPTDVQSNFFDDCVDRAENLDPKDLRSDNILKIISDASLVSLHPGLYDPEWVNEAGKVDSCINQALTLYHKYTNHPIGEKKYNLTQFIFSDLGTPGPKKDFDVYNHIKSRLMEGGIPARQIAFIQEGKNKKQKAEIIARMNDGHIRVLIGGSDSLGTGVNAQRLAIAAHLLTVPWVPSLDNQSIGRLVRPGNLNKTVYIYRYLTEQSLDGFRLQLCENKLIFTNQFLNGTLAERTIEDIDENTMSYAQMKAAVSGDPLVLEHVTLQNDLQRMKALWTEYERNQRTLREDLKNEKDYFARARQRHLEMAEANRALANADLETKLPALAQSLWPLVQQSGIFRQTQHKFAHEKIAVLAGFDVYHVVEIIQEKIDGQSRILPRHWVKIQWGEKTGTSFRVSMDQRNHAKKNLEHLQEAVELTGALHKIEQSIKDHNDRIQLLEAEYNKPFEHMDKINSLEERLLKIESLFEKKNDPS